MAHHVEPMDIDSDFDNKENSLHHSNVLPFTEKGYEELDVSELNMKLRYSITPASSPMSKSFTANCLDNRSLELGDDSLNVTVNENCNLTRSLNSTITTNDNVVKSLKALPLQALSAEQFVDNHRSTAVLRPLDSTVTEDNTNVTVTCPSDIDENLSLPSSSSSALQTPEATTPTKDISKNDGGSPIMRGLKTVLNMFRSSQSPIPSTDSEDIVKSDILSPAEPLLTTDEAKSLAMLASTPISAHRKKEASPTKRSSPNKESIVFNEDLEKELQWKDETTIIFSQERIPIHKLFFQQPQFENKTSNNAIEVPKQDIQDDMNSTVEYMDISYNDSIRDRTMTDMQKIGNKSDFTFAGESDGEFVDCETTFTKNESMSDDKDKTPVIDRTQDLDLTKDTENTNENTSASRLKQIILNTTQDILDATLSITPEDLIPEALEKIKNASQEQLLLSKNIEVNVPNKTKIEQVINQSVDVMKSGVEKKSLMSQEELPVTNQRVNIIMPDMNVQHEADPNITKIIQDNIQPVLDQTEEKTNLLGNEEFREDPYVTHTIANISAETTVPDNQSLQVDKLDLTSGSETIVPNDKIVDSQVDRTFTCNNVSNLGTNTTLDIEINRTGLNVTHIIEHDPSNTAIAEHSRSGTIEEAVNKLLPNSVDEVHPSPVKEASMTELPADEDDLDKELNVNITTETSITPNSLDLVDDIKLKFVNQEITDNVALEAEEKLEENDNILSPEVSTPLNDLNSDLDINVPEETQTLLLESQVRAVEKVIEHANVNNEKLLVSKEKQVETHINVLSEAAPSSTVENITENKKDKVPDDVKVMDKTETVTESLNTTVTGRIEQNVKQSQEVAPMDINESAIKFKPLPDIINQTVSVPDVENFESATDIVEPVILSKPGEPLLETLENVTNEVHYLEIEPEAMKKVVLELLSDANVPEVVKSEVTNDEASHVATETEEKKDPVTSVCESFMTEGIPVVTDTIPDVEINKVDVIPTDPNMFHNEKQSPDADNIPVNESAETKTLIEEIILSENNSPFVSVIAEDISEIKAEENVDCQNIDNQVETPGKVVITPPASPPITSKGYNFNFDEMDDPFATKIKIRMSPTLDTPNKAVETKASSRSAEIPMPKKEINNRRKSQPERKKPFAPKRKFNSTFSGPSIDKTVKQPEIFAAGDINLESLENVALVPSNVTKEEDKMVHEAKMVSEKALNVTNEVLKSELEDKIYLPEPSIEIMESLSNVALDPSNVSKEEDKLIHEAKMVSEKALNVTNEVLKSELEDKIDLPEPCIEIIETVEADLPKELIKTTSLMMSSNSEPTLSNESIASRNVFNLPEIDDVNFNSFATKSKMRQSPTPSLDIENPFATKCKIRSSPETSMIFPQNDKVKDEDITKTVLSDDKTETEMMEKDASGNLSNTTTSSRATDDRNTTMREVNTEDEDTIEGPFLEVEDLNTDDKMLDFDGENIDMMQFNDLHTQGHDENPDNGELFIDAEAFEFLLNQNKSNTIVDSGKESLFLKFDPLFAKRMSSITSDGVVASLSKFQKRQSTPTKPVKSPQNEVISPVAGPSNMNITQDLHMNMSEEFNDELNVTVSKPMMVVPPAVNPVTPRNKSLTPNRSNRRSFTFTSPAMAVIDRLLSLSGNSSHLHDTTVTQITREQNEADLALTQLRELLAEKEVQVYSLRSESHELKDRLTSLESHLKSLEDESQDRLKKIKDLNDRLAEKTNINKSMAAVVEEYERTIASLISETAQDKKRHAEERVKLINERDEQTAHLASMEVSFSDLHSKYEKSKQVILNCKANEDAYKKSIQEFEENLSKMQNNYELLKQHATSKLNYANQELEKMNKTHEAEVLKLNAMIKRKDLHITSLEESLTQKTKANEELTAICDELINKVG